ncbi:MAG: hypothetical protein DRJ35_08465 [Thermoprotei archaeon]|nr:MAG: hypothetical protein DRJ35_08465 [Thermoprotei archaeon]
MGSRIQEKIGRNKQENGDYLADTLIDICFVTSYKIEDLLKMPPTRRARLIERYKERFCKQ